MLRGTQRRTEPHANLANLLKLFQGSGRVRSQQIVVLLPHLKMRPTAPNVRCEIGSGLPWRQDERQQSASSGLHRQCTPFNSCTLSTSRWHSSADSEPCPDTAQQRGSWSGRTEYIAGWFVHGLLGVGFCSTVQNISIMRKGYRTSRPSRLSPKASELTR